MTQRFDIGRPHLGAERHLQESPTRQPRFDNRSGARERAAQEVAPAAQQRPRQEAGRQLLLGSINGVCCRKNVKEGETFRSVWLLERKAIGNTTTAIMPSY